MPALSRPLSQIPTHATAPDSRMQRVSTALRNLGRENTFTWIAVAAVAFQAAYTWRSTAPLVVVYLFGLVQIACRATGKHRFYAGLVVGFASSLGHLSFFWTIFSAGAIALWFVYSSWIGAFVALTGFSLDRFGRQRGLMVVPFLWMGMEWFRSEGYYLRFAWLTPGFAFADTPWLAPLPLIGVYGVGFLLTVVACLAAWRWSVSRLTGLIFLVLGTAVVLLPGQVPTPPVSKTPATSLRVAGIQLEFPTEPEVVEHLDKLVRSEPDLDLIVLSEYTFLEAIPNSLRAWCRRNKRYLVVGAKDLVRDKIFYNTAFVIGPEGQTVFRQAKSVPIQFFDDGLPAPGQELWDSPWGKIGLCICYDLSYRQVTDRLVRLGAEALIVPTMDVSDWGERQHTLHGRVAPVRAAEYGLPIFRLASSGISQLALPGGIIAASAGFPGQGEVITGELRLGGPGRLPLDSWIAPVSAVLAAFVGVLAVAWRMMHSLRGLCRCKPAQVNCGE